ncbi:MAG: hypothetical protein HZA16_08320 [Nitrospirae bacterium]|nr:hypothetical protein [Nitrospirota bacterium]
MNIRIYKYLLLVYALTSGVFLGGLTGFLIIYPVLQIVFDRLGINYGYDEPRWINYLIYSIVVLTIAVFVFINWRRYLRHLRKRTHGFP